MPTYTGKNDPTTALRVKLMEGLYVPRIWDWCSILRSQTDASRAANMCHMEGTLAAGGELVCTFTGEYASEDQVIHLELPAMYELLVIALEHLKVLCILDSCLPSLLVDEVNIITPELVLCGFVVCLDRGGGGMVTSGGKDGLNPLHQEERCLPYGPTG
jgi:hypothetical protein